MILFQALASMEWPLSYLNVICAVIFVRRFAGGKMTNSTSCHLMNLLALAASGVLGSILPLPSTKRSKINVVYSRVRKQRRAAMLL